MPVAVAVQVEEALVRSSAGRFEAEWQGGVAAGWRSAGALAVMVEADVTRASERSAVLDVGTTTLRSALLVEGHLGAPEDALRFTVAGGPGAAVAFTTLDGRTARTLLPGARLVLGTDAVLLPARLDGETWTVGLRMGGFGSARGVDLDLGVRTGLLF